MLIPSNPVPDPSRQARRWLRFSSILGHLFCPWLPCSGGRRAGEPSQRPRALRRRLAMGYPGLRGKSGRADAESGRDGCPRRLVPASPSDHIHLLGQPGEPVHGTVAVPARRGDRLRVQYPLVRKPIRPCFGSQVTGPAILGSGTTAFFPQMSSTSARRTLAGIS